MGQSRKGISINKGSHRTDEQKKNMSNARMGKKPSPETLINMSIGMMGKNVKGIICITTGIEYESTNEAAKLLNIKSRSINNILTGLAKQTRNKLTFKYL